MAKRGGKAATRRQRQRAANRHAPRPAASRPAGASSTGASEPSHVETVTTPAAVPASAAIPTTPSRRRTTTIAADLYGSSRLSEKAAAEYHYVVADLRNILVLSAVLAGLLVVAFIVVNVLGIGKVV